MRGTEALGFGLTPQIEASIVEPIAYEAHSELGYLIKETPAQGLLGVAAKLRYALERRSADFEDIEGEQLIEVIEREIGRAPAP